MQIQNKNKLLVKYKYFELLKQLALLRKMIENDKTIMDKGTANRHLLGIKRLIDKSFKLF